MRRGTPEHWMFPVPAESYGALGAVGPDDETLLEGRWDAGLKGEHVAVSYLPHDPRVLRRRPESLADPVPVDPALAIFQDDLGHANFSITLNALDDYLNPRVYAMLVLASPAPEVDRVHDLLAGLIGVAAGGPYPHLPEDPVEDVGPVAGTLHPALEAVVRSAHGPRPPRDVLAGCGPVVAEALQTGPDGLAVEGFVAKVAFSDHLLRMGAGGPRERGIHAKGS